MPQTLFFLYRYKNPWSQSILSLLSFVLSAQAACPAGEMALKQQNEKRAVSYFTRCALDRNEEDAQLWLAQYYQKQSQDDIGNVMKKLLFYHLSWRKEFR